MAEARRTASPLLEQRALSKLHWRCRRGLLENDLLIARFFERHESALTEDHAQGLHALMELADNDLLDLLLRRAEPQGAQATWQARAVLAMLRPAQGTAAALQTGPQRSAGPATQR